MTPGRQVPLNQVRAHAPTTPVCGVISCPAHRHGHGVARPLGRHCVTGYGRPSCPGCPAAPCQASPAEAVPSDTVSMRCLQVQPTAVASSSGRRASGERCEAFVSSARGTGSAVSSTVALAHDSRRRGFQTIPAELHFRKCSEGRRKDPELQTNDSGVGIKRNSGAPALSQCVENARQPFGRSGGRRYLFRRLSFFCRSTRRGTSERLMRFGVGSHHTSRRGGRTARSLGASNHVQNRRAQIAHCISRLVHGDIPMHGDVPMCTHDTHVQRRVCGRLRGDIICTHTSSDTDARPLLNSDDGFAPNGGLSACASSSTPATGEQARAMRERNCRQHGSRSNSQGAHAHTGDDGR